MFRYILLVLLFATNSLFAQTQKGSWMAGGSGSFFGSMNSGNLDNAGLSLSPKLGYFLANNFVMGLDLRYGYIGSKTSYSTSNNYLFSISPFIRYYVGKSKFKGFIEGEMGYGISETKISNTTPVVSNYKYKDDKLLLGISLGASYFFSERVSIEGSFRFSHPSGGTFLENNYRNLQFNVGFQIFFPKKTE